MNEELINDFIDELKNMDLSKIASNIKTAEVVTVASLKENIKNRMSQVLQEKLSRSIEIQTTTDPKVIAGAVLKFGSLAIDGSLANLLKEAGSASKARIEAV